MYFTPTNSKKIPPVIQGADCPLSDELYMKLMDMHKQTYDPTQWIYIADCVSRGTMSPMEAYDCIKLGYLAEHLSMRESLYINKL